MPDEQSDDFDAYRERMAGVMTKVQGDIERVGWSAIYVFADEEDAPSYCYSVGFHETLGAPEIIVFGFGRELAHAILAHAYERLKGGEILEPERRYEDFLEGFPVEFREVGKPRRPLNVARALYDGDEFPVLQLVWPDSQTGAFPWQENYTTDPRIQPLADGTWGGQGGT